MNRKITIPIIIFFLLAVIVYAQYATSTHKGDVNIWGDLNVTNGTISGNASGIFGHSDNVLNITGSVYIIDNAGIADINESKLNQSIVDASPPTNPDNIWLYVSSDTMYFNGTKFNTSIYYRTEIDTQGEMETIWGVTLSTDSERTDGLAAQDECSEIGNCVPNAWDADSDLSADEISEGKVNFSTVCGAGNHLYVSGNDLACEADDDTTYTSDDNYIYMVGTEFRFNDTKMNATGDTRYVNVDGDTMTGNLNMSENNITNLGDVFITEMKSGDSTYSSLNDAFNLFNSAGRITGGTIVASVGNSVIVTAGTGIARIADDDVSQVKFFDWSNSTGFNVSTDSIMYVGVDYNSGTPIIVNYSSDDNFDLDTSFPLGTIINQKDELYILNNPWWVSDGLTNVIERFQAEGWLERDDAVGGLILGYNAIRYPTLTGGTLWSRMTEHIIPAFDASDGDVFDYYYRDGSGSYDELSDQSQWNNTHYDDNSGTLVVIPNNQYAVIWVWINAASAKISLMFPQSYYSNAASAEAEEIPDYPSMWYKGGVIAGRIIIKQGVDAPVEIQSAFTTTFTAAQAADHSNLNNLDYASSGHTGFIASSTEGDLNVNHSDSCTALDTPETSDETFINKVSTVYTFNNTYAGENLIMNWTGLYSYPADGSANGNYVAVLGDTLTYDVPELVYDTTPSLGGNLDLDTFNVTNPEGANIYDDGSCLVIARNTTLFKICE